MKSELTVSEEKEESAILVVCPHCQTNIKIQVDLSLKSVVEDKGLDIAPRQIAPPQRFSLDAKKVAIAINGEGTREIIKELLEDAQFEVSDVASLEALFPVLREFHPATVLIDLSLPDAAQVRLSDAIAKELSPNKANLLLISPGYGKATASSEIHIPIAGADGYVERGNIQRDLVHKINLCLGSAAGAVRESPRQTEAFRVEEEQREEKIEEKPPFSLSPPMQLSDQEEDEMLPIPKVESAKPNAWSAFPAAGVHQREIETAKRLARIIVSDIILYNEKKVEEGVLHGTFYALLEEEIEEGRKHYNSRVSLAIQKQKDYLGDVLEDFLNRRKTASA